MAQEDAEAGSAMLEYLRQRVQQDPNHADSWRLLGRLERKRGDTTAAIAAVDRALTLDPANAAAHFDRGELMELTGRFAEADSHFRSVVDLAPSSQYAKTLLEAGKAGTPNVTLAVGDATGSEQAAMEQVDFEVQTFDSSDDFEDRFDDLRSDADPDLKTLRMFLETGVLYNSNVTLTPISRELVDADAAAFQAFASPDVEWIAVQQGLWRSGTIARGYFTINEGHVSEFDLASFQPGAFVERDIFNGASEWIARAEYLYSLDLLDGSRFGDRHSLTASVTAIQPDLDVIYSYVRVSVSDFENDGVTPVVTSLDGPAFAAGSNWFFQTGSEWMPTYGFGVDFESADTEGADFRYQAVNASFDTTWMLSQRLSFLPSAGVGYREYGDFTGPVSRDELTWRIQGRLKWQWSEHLAFSAFAGHDRFASDNEDFDAERTQGGVATTFQY